MEVAAGEKGLAAIPLSSLKNFKQVAPQEAKQFARVPKTLLYCQGYELDEGAIKELSEKGGALVFSFSDIIRESGFRRSILLSKMRIAYSICRDWNAGAVACTLANNENETRTGRELAAFQHMLGMNPQERAHSDELLEKLAGQTKAAKRGGKT
jgi:hypothetical protein